MSIVYRATEFEAGLGADNPLSPKVRCNVLSRTDVGVATGTGKWPDAEPVISFINLNCVKQQFIDILHDTDKPLLNAVEIYGRSACRWPSCLRYHFVQVPWRFKSQAGH